MRSHRPCGDVSRPRGCTPASSRATNARAAPGSCAGRRRPRADASRTSDAGDAGGGGAAAACSCRAGARAPRGRARRSRPAGELRPGVSEVAGEVVRGLLAERDDPLLAALAAHAHLLLLEVDVGQVEPDRLGAPQPRRVDELDERAVAQAEGPVAGERVDDRLDLLPLRCLGQALRPAWAERCVGNSRRAEREAEKGANGREPAGDRRRREAAACTAELGCVLGEHPDVDVVDVDAAPLEPAAEVAQVAAVGPARRRGERGRGEEAVDRGRGLHRGDFPRVAPCPVPPRRIGIRRSGFRSRQNA